jgi:hypothetical protein
MCAWRVFLELPSSCTLIAKKNEIQKQVKQRDFIRNRICVSVKSLVFQSSDCMFIYNVYVDRMVVGFTTNYAISVYNH